jgi:DNA-binding transcriptional MerR regulator
MAIDDLAARTGVPTRTIREYQTLGLVPPPERRGRVGVYRPNHVHRLEIIGRLQDRGYSLAGIKDLLTSWQDGHELTDLLGVEPDELVHIDEPGAPATVDQLTRLLPQLVPDHLDDILEVGLVDRTGPDRYCVPSPSLLQLTADALAAGYRAEQVLHLLRVVHQAAVDVARAAAGLLQHPPEALAEADLARLAGRGRGLLAHGAGRMAIYELGRHLDAAATTSP